jgi:hypothetical protein
VLLLLPCGRMLQGGVEGGYDLVALSSKSAVTAQVGLHCKGQHGSCQHAAISLQWSARGQSPAAASMSDQAGICDT